MPDTKIGRYRLARQLRGFGAFAEIEVTVRPARADDETRTVWAVDESQRTVTIAKAEPEFFSAALNGAQDGLDLADRLGADVAGLVACVTSLGFTVVDTEPTAVRAAASAAVIRALGMEHLCELTYENGWRYRPSNSE